MLLIADSVMVINKFCLVTYLIFSIQGSDSLTQALVGQRKHINRN